MVLTKELKKYIKSLQYVKFRQKYDKFIAEGPKICNEFISENNYNIEYIVVTENWIQQNENNLRHFKGKTIVCNDKDLKSISSLKTPNNILMVLERKFTKLYDLELSNQWSIFCDRIQDPGNMGTIIRTADWFGLKNVIATEDSVDFFNPKTVQSSMGGHNRVNLINTSAQHIIDNHKDHLVALALDGVPIEKFEKRNQGIIVVGNESQGISQEIAAASKKISINKKGGAESLNASVACGIACFYFTQ
jgi:TrmH family RNA methyltransferase